MPLLLEYPILPSPTIYDGSSVVIFGSVSEHNRNSDSYLSELCNSIGTTLLGFGNVLIPINPVTFVFDVFETVSTYLSTSAYLHIPIYFIDPLSEHLLSYSNISAEYLSRRKKEKANVPEQPFPVSSLLRGGKMRIFNSIQDPKFGVAYQEPCVIFAGHSSLRFGDAVAILDRWKGNPKNSLILVDPEYDLVKTLSVFPSLALQVFHIPLDWSLNIVNGEVDKLLQAWKPKHVVINERYSKKIGFKQQQDISTFKQLDILSLSLKRKYERCIISTELAEQIKPVPLHIPTSSGGTGSETSLAYVSALLTLKDGVYHLTTESPSLPLRNQTKKFILCAPQWKRLYDSLEDMFGADKIEVEEDSFNRILTLRINIDELNDKEEEEEEEEDTNNNFLEIILKKTDTLIKTNNLHYSKVVGNLIAGISQLK